MRILRTFLLCSSALYIGSVHAAPFAWVTTQVGTESWNVNTNWSPNGFPNSINDTAIFNSTVSDIPVQINLEQGITINEITFSSNGNYTVANAVAQNFALTFATSVTSSSPTVSLSAGVNGVLALSAPVTLTSPNSLNINNLTAENFIIGGQITGPTGLLLNVGNMQLTNATNTYAGGTSILGGSTLFVSASGNLGTGGLTFDSGTLNTSGSFTFTNTVTLTGDGTFDVESGQTLTLSGLITGGGSLTKADAGTLVLGDAGNLYAGGTIIAGGVLSVNNAGNLGAFTGTLTFNPAAGQTATLESTATFTIGPGGSVVLSGPAIIDTNDSTLTIASVISGGGSLTKIDETGTLILSGVNTYLGGTTISAGVLTVSQDSNLGNPSGGITFNQQTPTSTPTLHTTASFSSARSIMIAGATGSPNSTFNTDTGTTLTLTGPITGPGPLTKIGAGTLTLTNASNAYAGGTFINAGVLSVSQDAVMGTNFLNFDGGTLQTTGSFSSSKRVFLTGAGTIDTTDGNTLTLSGLITGSGSLTKTDTGTLILTGNNTYTGGTTVSGGTLEGTTSGLQGPITNDAAVVFNQSNTGTYAGVMSGPGTVTIAGSGKVIFSGANTYTGFTTISGGTFCVNGSITSNTTVDAGTTLCGTGTITGTVHVFGTLSPGNSIGTLTVMGPVTFETGSTYQVEINPTQADLLNVTEGGVTIDPGVTFALMPDMGDYANNTTYLVIQTTGGVTGTFSGITNSFPLFVPTLTYTADDVFLTVGRLPFGPFIPSGNAKNIAQCFDAAHPSAGTDLALIIDELLMQTDTSALQGEFNQLQPSQLKGLALSQENNGISVREALSSRMEDLYEPTCKSDRDRQREWDIWTDLFGDISQQKSLHHEPGYRATTGGALLGADYFVLKNLHLGAAAAYTYTNLHWQHSRGRGDIQSYYGLVYGGFFTPHFFANASVRGAYNQYEAKRHIQFLTIDRNAKSVFGGREVGTHLTVGGLFEVYKLELNPFLTFDYMHLHQDSFKERGAKSLNLRVKDSNYNLFRGEAGLSFSRCFRTNHGKWIPMAKFSVIRELRYQGAHYSAQLVDTGCSFSVKGMKPDRTLYAPAAGLIALLCDEKISVSLKYEGEFGKRFWDQKLNNTVVANISFALGSKKKPAKMQQDVQFQQHREESSYSPPQESPHSPPQETSPSPLQESAYSPPEESPPSSLQESAYAPPQESAPSLSTGEEQ